MPLEHELTKKSELTFADINGFNFLLRTELGFWDTLCREKMPASKFLVQSDPATFEELVRASTLPCFSTDYSQRQGGYPDRVNISLTDAEAQVTFYLAKRKQRELLRKSSLRTFMNRRLPEDSKKPETVSGMERRPRLDIL